MEPVQKAVEYAFYELFGCFYETLTKGSHGELIVGWRIIGMCNSVFRPLCSSVFTFQCQPMRTPNSLDVTSLLFLCAPLSCKAKVGKRQFDAIAVQKSTQI